MRKVGSPFSECELRDCKIRSLTLRGISCCTRPHMFLLHSIGLNFFVSRW